MNKILFPWTVGLGAAVSLFLNSCAYDPYYSSAGGYYSGGGGSYYGDGYGYGGSSFSTSLFVTTGDPRWGYDPNTYCYYDYGSRRYYDPYLYGYYPIGYRPHAVYGVPHPHGWRPGRGYCPPPRTVRDVTVVNYRNRESAYRNSDYSWARQVKQRSDGDSHHQQRGDSRPYSGRQDYRPESRDRQTDSLNSRSWSPRETSRTREYTPESRGNYAGRPSSHQAVRTDPQAAREIRPESTRGQSMTRPQPSRQQFENRGRGGDQPRMQAPQSAPPEKKADSWKSDRRNLRSLGDA